MSKVKTNKTAAANGKGLRYRIHDAIDETATTAENIHKAVVNLPFDALERTNTLEETAREAKKLQGELVGVVYRLVRKINGEVRTLGDDLLH